MEFHELLVVLDDRTGHLLGKSLRQRATQMAARFLDAFVAGEFLGHGSIPHCHPKPLPPPTCTCRKTVPSAPRSSLRSLSARHPASFLWRGKSTVQGVVGS